MYVKSFTAIRRLLRGETEKDNFGLVRMAGFEPALTRNEILSFARLPTSPHPLVILETHLSKGRTVNIRTIIICNTFKCQATF